MNIQNEKTEYFNSPLTVIKGIGPKKAQLFAKLGIHTVWDLLYYFPGGYEDRRTFKRISECAPGEVCCLKLRPARQIVERRLKPKLSLFLLYASDGHETVCVKWFSAPFAKPKIRSGHIYNVYGVMTSNAGKKEFEMRYMEDESEAKYTGVIVPVYRATAGINSRQIAETVDSVLCRAEDLPDCFEEDFRIRHSLISICDAVKSLHRPSDFSQTQEAHKRLAFEELFVLTLALSMIKDRRSDKAGITVNVASGVREYASKLPYELTDGQKKAINDICADMKSGRPMNRLVQGDVGCGKTAIAASVMYALAKLGYQSVFMAPTEILAQQHFATLQKMFGDEVKIALFTSSVKNKKQLTEDVSNGEYDVVVGTHALIEDNVRFSNLALCITDEQHRFGVNQRALLSAKSNNPHILVMSATPIPRTLSLILYGDLDISVVKSMPRGRMPVETYHIAPKIRERAYGFLLSEISQGHQCYIVCPLVEDSQAIEALSVESTVESLRNGILQGVRIECVHGKMKASEKDEIMKRFKDREIDILVSTTVIEVGVDVPNATVMLIENAERFGLSQLHQLRGRVGRGESKSYCILVSDCSTDNCRERMKIMTESSDGFVISQKDLELRGSGQFFGTRQHGLPELKVANLFEDSHILQEAVEAAKELVDKDPGLMSPSFSNIRSRIETLFEGFDGADIFN